MIEIRICQNCEIEFRIDPEDFAFYEKMQVPAPTWCPECRLQRRLSFLNFIRLYKRPCDLCKKEFVTNYHPDAAYTVYCPECWWSDKWDPLDYGRDYDFSRPFFEQFAELWKKVPVIGLAVDLQTVHQSPYNNYTGGLKDCYLLFQAGEDENAGYGVYVFGSRDMYDCSLVRDCEQCFDSMHSYKVSNGVGIRGQLYESSDCKFLRDSHGCHDCAASANLHNKQYYIFNRPYAKEEYKAEMKKWEDLGSYKKYQEFKQKAETHWATYPRKLRQDEFSTDCTGNYVFSSKNCKDCYEVMGAEDSRYLLMTHKARDSYDISMWGDIERCYDGIVGVKAVNVRFGFLCFEGAYDTEYSVLSHNGSTGNFGCVSMRKRDYCILNKQYGKEEYLRVTEKIRKQMVEMPYRDRRGRDYRYGEFFPSELSPWGYNETLAFHRAPLTREHAAAQGFLWRAEQKPNHKIDRNAADLPDHIRDATDDILQETIGCEKCKKGFRIIPRELAFLRQKSFPLPRQCPFCRISEKLDMWMRELKSVRTHCTRCRKEIEIASLYASERVLLCKECYQNEVV